MSIEQCCKGNANKSARENRSFATLRLARPGPPCATETESGNGQRFFFGHSSPLRAEREEEEEKKEEQEEEEERGGQWENGAQRKGIKPARNKWRREK